MDALVTSLRVLYQIYQTKHNVIFGSFLAITPVWNFIETWGFRVDDPCDFPDSPISAHNNVTKPNITQPLKNGIFWHNSSLEFEREQEEEEGIS